MSEPKTALVIGAGGFIGHNLVKRLVGEGWAVTGMDVKYPAYEKTAAYRFLLANATTMQLNKPFNRIYQLAADMGGAGFVFTGDNDAEILTNSLSINLRLLQEITQTDARRPLPPRMETTIFYSSSVCCYPDDVRGVESDAYPANPPSNYGWEKLTSERLYLAYAAKHGINVRIARFHNCFGPFGTYEGGREKSPAAICRKVIEAKDGGEIEIWGDGEQLRPFIFIDDLLDGIEALMSSDYRQPVNLGPGEDDEIPINELVNIICEIAGKKLARRHVAGPTGGQIRRANNDLARTVLKWEPKISLRDALDATYRWIEREMNKS